jgi:hypothetical protein
MGLSDRAARTDGERNPRVGNADTSTAIHMGVMVLEANSDLREILDVAVRKYHIPIDRPVGKMKSQHACKFATAGHDKFLLSKYKEGRIVFLFLLLVDGEGFCCCTSMWRFAPPPRGRRPICSSLSMLCSLSLSLSLLRGDH